MNFTFKAMRPCFAADTCNNDGSNQDEDGDAMFPQEKSAPTDSKRKCTVLVERTGEHTQKVTKMICSFEQTSTDKDRANELAEIEKQLMLQEFLKISMNMYRMQNDCPDFVAEYFEGEMKATISKLQKTRNEKN